MKKAKSINPVILLDEIDKMAHDMHGDPSSALLEVLDHEQNNQFVDHYLDVEYNLSQVMFIATANVIEHIPYPLFDRLEMIYLSGYTEEEKITIAQQFLIPRVLKEHGLTKRQFKLSAEILQHVIDKYTKEAGVRQLDRVLAKLVRKTIQVLLQEPTTKSVDIDEKIILDWLGYPTNRKTTLNTVKKKIGLATGLAWTELGGDVLEIEVSVLPGKGTVTLTGQLGEVMQESAQAALSYIRSRAKDLGIPQSFHTTKDIHIHMPEGATPKDGPSAGIAITTALISALTKTPVRNDIAMTGETTLQGRVLAIGGLKEKLLAAKQYGMETVIVPQENYNDILEVKKEADLKPLRIIFADHVDTIFDHAFVKNPLKKKK
jgi:ATP-dependent Lon protease